MMWAEFVLAFGVFFASHSIPVRPPVRPWLVARLGTRGFLVAYSFLSLAVLGWLILAAGRAPYVELWSWAPWQSRVTLALMLPACLLFGLAIARPNPFSFGGARNERFDPAHPGILRWTRHPILTAAALWALSHMAPNGDLAHLLLFGSFAAFSILGKGLVDRRKRREMGESWQDLLARVRETSFVPKPASYPDAAARFAIGLGLFLALIWLHPILLGIDPLAGLGR